MPILIIDFFTYIQRLQVLLYLLTFQCTSRRSKGKNYQTFTSLALQFFLFVYILFGKTDRLNVDMSSCVLLGKMGKTVVIRPKNTKITTESEMKMSILFVTV